MKKKPRNVRGPVLARIIFTGILGILAQTCVLLFQEGLTQIYRVETTHYYYYLTFDASGQIFDRLYIATVYLVDWSPTYLQYVYSVMSLYSCGNESE